MNSSRTSYTCRECNKARSPEEVEHWSLGYYAAGSKKKIRTLSLPICKACLAERGIPLHVYSNKIVWTPKRDLQNLNSLSEDIDASFEPVPYYCFIGEEAHVAPAEILRLFLLPVFAAMSGKEQDRYSTGQFKEVNVCLDCLRTYGKPLIFIMLLDNPDQSKVLFELGYATRLMPFTPLRESTLSL